MERNQIHLDPGCPWYELSEYRLPNIKWCEENLCSWIVNPANTWSNLAYLFVGILVFWNARTYATGSTQKKLANLFGSALWVVGTGSFIYHQSYAFLTQLLDFFGMFWYLLLVFYLNLIRMGRLTFLKLRPIWITSVLVATALMAVADFNDIPVQSLIMIIAVVLMSQEILISRKLNELFFSKTRAYFFKSILFLIAAAICTALDLKRIWCDPENHWVQGHAVWHVLSAVGLYLYSQFFIQSQLIEKEKI